MGKYLNNIFFHLGMNFCTCYKLGLVSRFQQLFSYEQGTVEVEYFSISNLFVIVYL